MIINSQTNNVIPRIFAYMAIITCLITMEIVRGQDNLSKSMTGAGLCELEEKYRMCSS